MMDRMVQGRFIEGELFVVLWQFWWEEKVFKKQRRSEEKE
jgi:hypothetical protein